MPSTPTDPTQSSGEDSVPWWLREPPASSGPADDDYDASLDCDGPDDDYSQSDLDYFADREADRYERWLYRDS